MQDEIPGPQADRSERAKMVALFAFAAIMGAAAPWLAMRDVASGDKPSVAALPPGGESLARNAESPRRPAASARPSRAPHPESERSAPTAPTISLGIEFAVESSGAFATPTRRETPWEPSTTPHAVNMLEIEHARSLARAGAMVAAVAPECTAIGTWRAAPGSSAQGWSLSGSIVRFSGEQCDMGKVWAARGQMEAGADAMDLHVQTVRQIVARFMAAKLQDAVDSDGGEGSHAKENLAQARFILPGLIADRHAAAILYSERALAHLERDLAKTSWSREDRSWLEKKRIELKDQIQQQKLSALDDRSSSEAGEAGEAEE